MFTIRSKGDLEGKKASYYLNHRDFLWDSVVLFTTLSILMLAVFDIAMQFLRESRLECHMNSGEVDDGYIRNYCFRFIPSAEYLSLFILISSVCILIPHFVWLSYNGGNVESFFSHASMLDRQRSGDSGEHTNHNIQVMRQLERAFGNSSLLFKTYIIKLTFQWIISATGFLFAIYLFSDFTEVLFCPQDESDLSSHEWPFDSRALCVFASMRLLWGSRIAYIFLLNLVILNLTWGLVWCWLPHLRELGSKNISQFTFSSGIQSKYYAPKMSVPRCCHIISNSFNRCHSIFLVFSRAGLTISSDLDFMVIKLFQTDRGLGSLMKDVQVTRHLQLLQNVDRRQLSLHYKKHTSLESEDVPYDREYLHHELKWLFKKRKDEMGIYFDFRTIGPLSVLHIPTAMHGAVLAFGARAPNNGGAISVSFGSTGYASALARVFRWVGSINFNPYYIGCVEKSTYVEQCCTNVLNVTCKEDILSSNMTIHNQFLQKVKELWVPPNQNDFIDTTFMVIAPIDEDVHLTTVDLLLEQFAGVFAQDAVLLIVRPLMISGKNVRNKFYKYRPSGTRFTQLNQEVNILFGEGAKQWMARGFAPTNQIVQSYSVAPMDNICSVPGVKCGKTKCVIEFATYKYTGNPPAARPTIC